MQKLLLPIVFCTITASACSDAGEARVNRVLDKAADSAGSKLERLGAKLDGKVKNVLADARAPKDAVDTANQQNDAVFKNNSKAKSDARWAVKAYAAGLYQIELGKLAATNGAAQQVKTLAQKIINTHTDINSGIKSIATANSIKLPDDVPASNRDRIIALIQKTGTDFDRAYSGQVISDHRNEINVYSGFAANGKDVALRSFAAKQVPVLKSLLASAGDTELQTRQKSTPH